ncbi:MAG: hypothetical protein Q9195_005438 [Heterodermia aff. obscurata]
MNDEFSVRDEYCETQKAIWACTASIFRTVYSIKLAQGPDVSYNVVVLALGGLTELAIGVVVACLPVLPRFFQHHKSILSTKIPSYSWSRFATSANMMISPRGQVSGHEKHEQSSRTTVFILPSVLERPEFSRDTKDVVINIPEVFSSEESRSSKAPPLSPFLEDQVQDAFASPGQGAQLNSVEHYGSPTSPLATHRYKLEK